MIKGNIIDQVKGNVSPMEFSKGVFVLEICLSTQIEGLVMPKKIESRFGLLFCGV